MKNPTSARFMVRPLPYSLFSDVFQRLSRPLSHSLSLSLSLVIFHSARVIRDFALHPRFYVALVASFSSLFVIILYAIYPDPNPTTIVISSENTQEISIIFKLITRCERTLRMVLTPVLSSFLSST